MTIEVGLMPWSTHAKLATGPHALATFRPAPSLHRAVLAGTGSAVPARVVRNDEFPAALNTNDEWIASRTGIRERRVAGPDESSFTLALGASQQALRAAGLSAEDLDLIICATFTPQTAVPSNSCRLHGALGCRPVGAFDVAGACTGWIQSLSIASQFIATGACRHVLVVGTELLSRVTDFTDRASCILFGDGAGAAVLSAADGDGGGEGSPRRGVRWSRLYADGSRAEMITSPSAVTHAPVALAEAGAQSSKSSRTCGRHLQLNGREVFKFAVRTMAGLIQDALSACELSADRVVLVPHQVNLRIIDAALSELPVRPRRVILNLDRYGNTSAASVPIALDEAVRTEQVKPGDDLLLVAFGGGMTWGGALIGL